MVVIMMPYSLVVHTDGLEERATPNRECRRISCEGRVITSTVQGRKRLRLRSRQWDQCTLSNKSH
jgi:hypothetical protein